VLLGSDSDRPIDTYAVMRRVRGSRCTIFICSQVHVRSIPQVPHRLVFCAPGVPPAP
jgi:hypothetical protein